MENTDIYKLKLHQSLVGDRIRVTRVPGGRLYTITIEFSIGMQTRQKFNTVFVPYDDEYEDKGLRPENPGPKA